MTVNAERTPWEFQWKDQVGNNDKVAHAFVAPDKKPVWDAVQHICISIHIYLYIYKTSRISEPNKYFPKPGKFYFKHEFM